MITEAKIFAQGDQNLLLENTLAPLQLIFLTLATRFISIRYICGDMVGGDFLLTFGNIFVHISGRDEK